MRFIVNRALLRIHVHDSFFKRAAEMIQAMKVERIQRGLSVPASMKSPGNHKGLRMTKDERKLLVESFVKRYRADNDGSFPTISLTRKNVGGSYYVVREIIQEILFKQKKSGHSDIVSTIMHENNPEDNADDNLALGLTNLAMTQQDTKRIMDQRELVGIDDGTSLGHVAPEDSQSPAIFDSININISEKSPEVSNPPISSGMEDVHIRTEESTNLPTDGLERSQYFHANVDAKVQKDHEIQSGGTADLSTRLYEERTHDSSTPADDRDRQTEYGASISGYDKSHNNRAAWKSETAENLGEVDGRMKNMDVDNRSDDEKQLKPETLEENTVWNNLKNMAKGIFSFWTKH